MSSGSGAAEKQANEEMAERFASIVFPEMNPLIGTELMTELLLEEETRKRKPDTQPIPEDTKKEAKEPKKKEYKPRTHIKRTPKEESHWYRRYLHPDQRSSIQRGEAGTRDAKDKKMAKSFYSTFRVYFALFTDLVKMALERGSSIQ